MKFGPLSGNSVIEETLSQDSKKPVQSRAIYEYIENFKNTIIDEDGKILNSALPSFVDDVIEGYYHDGSFYKDTEYNESVELESGKIYLDINDSKTYRYDGNSLVLVSTNFTLSEKDKLSGIESGAQVNIIENIKVNGTALTVTDKAVDIIMSVDVDNSLSTTSENPVQNKVVKAAIDTLDTSIDTKIQNYMGDIEAILDSLLGEETSVSQQLNEITGENE